MVHRIFIVLVFYTIRMYLHYDERTQPTNEIDWDQSTTAPKRSQQPLKKEISIGDIRLCQRCNSLLSHKATGDLTLIYMKIIFFQKKSLWFLLNLWIRFITCYAWMNAVSFSGIRRPLRLPTRLPTCLKDSKVSIETIHGKWNSTMFASTQCWGRRPLLMRNAFDTEDLPKWEDIFNLACNNDEDEPITSRLIQHYPGTLDTYTIEFGPFVPEDLKHSLSTDHEQETMASTLVVNDVDRWIPSVSDWMDSQFEFLPRWRRDDAQVSIAPIGGGIGPHVDNYDVFLIQTCGSREWEVGCDEISVEEEFSNLVEESQVRILNLPISAEKLHLQAGDCLYLPPRIMHFGTSTSDECTTLSVGCRAPSAADLLSRIAESLATSTSAAAVKRYTDLDLLNTTDQSLSPEVKCKMKELVIRSVEDFVSNDAEWDRLIGALVTEPNRPTLEYPISLNAMDEEWKRELGVWSDADSALDAFFGGKGTLRRAEGVSFAWSSLDSSSKYLLYAQGQVFEVEDDGTFAPGLLCRIANGAPLDQGYLREIDSEMPSTIRGFLRELLEEGFLYGDDEIAEDPLNPNPS